MSITTISTETKKEAFITEIDSVRNDEEQSDLLDQVRKEHNKVREIVNFFIGKVDNLVDKQRNEYIQAYENHMQDVQRELFQLREKVAEIANDDTKSEKMERLKSDQIRYKDEALELEAASDELRKRMRVLVSKIYSVEKSRDWLLKKLRSAKRDFEKLSGEKTKLFEESDNHTQGTTSIASISQESNYTLELRMRSLAGGGAGLRKQMKPYGKPGASLRGLHSSKHALPSGKGHGGMSGKSANRARAQSTESNMDEELIVGGGPLGSATWTSRGTSKERKGNNRAESGRGNVTRVGLRSRAGSPAADVSGGMFGPGREDGRADWQTGMNRFAVARVDPLPAIERVTSQPDIPESALRAAAGAADSGGGGGLGGGGAKIMRGGDVGVEGVDSIGRTARRIAPYRPPAHLADPTALMAASAAGMNVAKSAGGVGGKGASGGGRRGVSSAGIGGTGAALPTSPVRGGSSNNNNNIVRDRTLSPDRGGAGAVAPVEPPQIEAEKQAKERITVLRSRKQEIREFLRYCSTSCHRRPWYRVKVRPFGQLLEDCASFASDRAHFEAHPEEALQLACELAAIPATYEALLDIVGNMAIAIRHSESSGEGRAGEAENGYGGYVGYDGREATNLLLVASPLSAAADGGSMDEVRGEPMQRSEAEQRDLEDFRSKLKSIIDASPSAGHPSSEKEQQQDQLHAADAPALTGPAFQMHNDVANYFEREKSMRSLHALPAAAADKEAEDSYGEGYAVEGGYESYEGYEGYEGGDFDQEESYPLEQALYDDAPDAPGVPDASAPVYLSPYSQQQDGSREQASEAAIEADSLPQQTEEGSSDVSGIED